MRQAIGYVRVSTEGQVHEGISLEAQEARIRAWAIANDYTVTAIHSDAGISGGRADNRPGLQRAIAEAGQGVALVVYSLSRLARSTKDAIAISEALAKRGADLVSLTERIDTTTASGKMVFRMMAVLAEFERDQISERTKTALAFKKSQSKRVGTVPFGHDLAPDGETLVKNPAEQEAICLILELRKNGLSLRKIKAELEAHGFKTKQARTWSPKVVRSILTANEIPHLKAA
jgi:DNA invertase Pin-like site-specific DNA recombinase